jgi:hypothetical protein
MSRSHPHIAVILACTLSCCAAFRAEGAVINAGIHSLAPNTPGQSVQILVSGGEAVSGIDLFVQVGDGGATAGGDDTRPVITHLDLVTDTIFASNNTGAFVDSTPLLWGATTTTANGSVSANGVLATLTIDTTGLSAGQFDLLLDPPTTGPTAFADSGVTTSRVNGSLQIGAVPAIAGDYNQNGTVDAADYALWRDTLNQSGAGLPADGNGNSMIDAGDYDVWRTHFGQSAGQSAALDAVPEPSTWLLIAMSAVITGWCRRPARTRRRSF